MREPKIPPPCFDFLKAEMVDYKDGKVTVRFRPTPEMENPHGLIQGGILAGMLDNVIGPAVAFATPDRQSSTIQMNVHFLKSVKAGQKIIGTAEVVKLGKTQALVEAMLTSEEDGTLLAKATAVNVFILPECFDK